MARKRSLAKAALLRHGEASSKKTKGGIRRLPESSVEGDGRPARLLLADDFKERQRAEQALRESEERNRLIIETAHDAFVGMNAKGVITDWNPQAEKTFGWSREEVLGRLLRDTLIPERYREAHTRGLERFLRTGEGPVLNRRFEITALHRDGHEFPVEMTISPVRRGESHLFNAFLHDITERKAAEGRRTMQFAVTRALAESNTLEQATPRILQAICESLGWEVAVLWLVDHEAQGLRCAQFWHLPSRDVAEFEAISRATTFTSGVGLPGRIWASNEPAWITDVTADSNFPRAPYAQRVGLHGACGFPIPWGGKLVGVIEFFSGEIRRPDLELLQTMADIGSQLGNFIQRTRAEEALRAAESQFRGLVEQSLVGICIVQNGLMAYANPKLAAIFGYTPEEILSSKRMLDLVAEEDRALVAERHRQRIEGEVESDHYTFRGLRRDGKRINIEVHARRTELDGRPAVFSTLLDTTERSQLEEHLRHAQKMEAIGRLAGGVAHDFNNLLTAILGYSDVLLSELSEGQAGRSELQEIRKAGERAAALTRQLLAFSRKQVLEPKVLNLNTVVTNLEKMLRRLIDEDIALETVLDPKLRNIRADAGQLEQVIMNLIVNARDAMPRGGKLTIETANIALDGAYPGEHVAVRPGRYVLLAVTDTGTGMNAETKAHLFEPFFTTKETGDGTGLGLATVYGIVEQSGGHIWVYSEPGRGSTFKIYLPIARERVTMPGRSQSVTTGGTETVLLVEDEALVRSLARRVLKMSGYSVLEARDGEQALEIARDHAGPIHLLLTDVVMPVMGGSELASRVQALHPEIKVVYMSGYTDDNVVRQGILEEGSAFLHKPFTADMIARKVREVLDQPQASRGSAESEAQA